VKRFFALSFGILVSYGVYESLQWFREPSLEVWAERSWFAIGGAMCAFLNMWLDP
jgi:hypothetical protein